MFCELTEESDYKRQDLCGRTSIPSDTDLRKHQDTPLSPTKTQLAAIFGDIVISDSENVCIGNKTYFNGSVTIRQIVLPESSVKEVPEKSKNYIWQRDCPWTALLVAVLTITIVTLWFLSKLLFHNVGNPMFPNINKNHSDYIYNYTKNGLQIVTRSQWSAQPPDGPLFSQTLPADKVVIGHTKQTACCSTAQCILAVRSMQTHDIEEQHFPDIRHNFLIGGDGRAYVGLGWNVIGYHTVGYNSEHIDITFVGNFKDFKPEEKQINAALLLIETGVQLGKISNDYEIFAQCQLLNVNSPGKYLYLNLTGWSHFNNSIKCKF